MSPFIRKNIKGRIMRSHLFFMRFLRYLIMKVAGNFMATCSFFEFRLILGTDVLSFFAASTKNTT
jgi:hypothetical protein